MKALQQITKAILLLLIAMGVASYKPESPYCKDLGRNSVRLYYRTPGHPEDGYKLLEIGNRHRAVFVQLDSTTKITFR